MCLPPLPPLFQCSCVSKRFVVHRQKNKCTQLKLCPVFLIAKHQKHMSNLINVAHFENALFLMIVFDDSTCQIFFFEFFRCIIYLCYQLDIWQWKFSDEYTRTSEGGVVGGTMPPPPQFLAVHLLLVQPGWIYYAHHITNGSPRFLDLTLPLSNLDSYFL